MRPIVAHARLGALLSLLAIPASTLTGQATGSPDSAGTSVVFRRYADRVVKIEVLETGSGAKATVGSGWFVTDRGHVITNYHVISNLINHPDRYRADVIDRGNVRRPLTILAVDVIHDAALVSTGTRSPHHFALPDGDPRIQQGDRLYALGHPHDLGLTIVEGTYNGPLEHTLYPKLHFTGSLNPGMSGGPTITDGGHVVGINVRTAGNQVSFLIPVNRARALLDRALAPGFAPPKEFLGDVATQLRASQAEYTAKMFLPDSKQVTLGGFELPTEPAPFFRCWGDAVRRKEEPYQLVNHDCSTEDYVFISGDQSSGLVNVSHVLVSSTELNPMRLYTLFQRQLDRDDTMEGEEEDFTPFRCNDANVRNGATTVRAAFCLRGYKRLPGLYDAVVKAAVLGRSDAGAVTTLTLTGVTFETAQSLTRRYLARIR
jgi:serine protease Do